MRKFLMGGNFSSFPVWRHFEAIINEKLLATRLLIWQGSKTPRDCLDLLMKKLYRLDHKQISMKFNKSNKVHTSKDLQKG